LDWLQEDKRKNNIFIFGFAEGDNENYIDLIQEVYNKAAV
jgi:hypothetical protein